MSERDALYAAVLAAPADDLPRLVYADWCDDHGEPDRAEFIRVQCELARLPADDPRGGLLSDRADELLADGHHRWKVSGIRGVQGFVRGFVEQWDGTAEWLLAAAGRLFELAPVRAVRVRNADKHIGSLCRLPGLAKVEALDLSGNTLAAHNRLERLLTEAPLGRLRSLKVGNNRLFADALPQIAGTPAAPRLTSLDLSGNPLADEGLVALAGLTRLGVLTSLTIRNNEQPYEDSVGEVGVRALAESAAFPLLTRLDLSGHHLADDGFAALIDSPLAGRLDEARVAQNWIGQNDGSWIERLTRPDRTTVPRLLDVSGRKNVLGRRAAELLATWSKLADGVTVDVRGCLVLGPDAYAALADSPHRGTRLLIDDLPPEGYE